MYLEILLSVTAWRGPVPMMMARGGGGGRIAFAAAADGPMLERKAMKSVERVRKLFPETWMWHSQTSSYVCCHLLLLELLELCTYVSTPRDICH